MSARTDLRTKRRRAKRQRAWEAKPGHWVPSMGESVFAPLLRCCCGYLDVVEPPVGRAWKPRRLAPAGYAYKSVEPADP